METKQTGRVIFILTVLIAALFSICPQPQRLFENRPWSERLHLKPGIDMVGGTSLLYQIKQPEGGYRPSSGNTLAEDVMESLKKRVDPNGLRNLIWRPQGADRLEIQIPASSKSDDANKARTTYSQARRQLDETNVRGGEVTDAIEDPKGAQVQRLAELAAGDPERATLFNSLVKIWTEKQAAHARQDAATEAEKKNEYENLTAKIDESNLTSQELDDILGGDPAKRADKLAALEKDASGYPARVEAIKNYVLAYDAYDKVKGSIDDAAQLEQLLRGSGVLEFHIVAEPNDTIQASQYQVFVQRLKDKGPRVEAGDQVQWYQIDRQDEVRQGLQQEWNDKYYVLCWITPERSMVNGPGIDRWSLEKAFRSSDKDGGAAVGFQFDAIGGKYFGDMTGANKGKLMATVLDDKVISAATINDRITDSGTISRGGGYDDAELGYLISTFNAGSLPAQLEDEPISVRNVGPQLGEDNLKAGRLACEFGLGIVAIFLISYYYLAGVVATFAVFMNVALILGILAAFNATFTLPGIAGIVLTIGAAVDANVLVFERLREEQHRGLSLRMAMRNAYSQAASAIIDSNATTVITSIILVWIGSEEVKGFGLTLLIGLISSLFTSLYVTRTIFNVMIGKFNVQNLSSLPLTFPKWDRLLKPDIDWMKYVPYFVLLSAVLIVSGMTAFVLKARSNELEDIDFASGTEVQFELKNAMNIAELRALFTANGDPHALPAISIQSVNNDNKTYEIITPNQQTAQVRDAVLKVVGTNIKADLPSKFDRLGEKLESVVGSAVVPIVKVPLVINGWTVPKAENYLGGAAIVMNNLNPPLKVGEIEDRIDRERLALQTDKGNQYHDFTVVSPSGADSAASTAVLLTYDAALPYDKDEAKWRENLVRPMWELVNESLNKQAQLQKVNSFDAQVASDTQQAALMALILSSLVIMIFIWFRFGNLKYGTATVLAMLHDTFLVVGGIGLSHWIVQFTPGLAKILLIEPLRINLTIVAAVLTIMSYSMIDTIVVFDRIRENRGKFGHLSRKIVNDSINQTLSRTLLTCGTTIVTVAGMYIVGGEGIHGFTFVLLVGILVGTYSSIAIAAPMLLFGADVKREEGPPKSGPPTAMIAGSGGPGGRPKPVVVKATSG